MEVTGTLVSLRTYDERWGIGRLKISQAQAREIGFGDDALFGGDSVAVVGDCLVGLSEGGDYRMRGKLVRHPKYGDQLQVDAAAVEIAPNPSAIKRFLMRNLHGVGEVSATKVVEKFEADGKLEDLRQILLSNPLSLDVAAITGRRVKIGIKDGADQGIEQFIHRDLAIRLSAGIVNDGTLRRIAAWLAGRIPSATSPDAVPRAWEMFSKDPYLPIMFVEGYGFSQADAIGASLDFSKDHPSRLAALAMHAVTNACESVGHIFLTRQEFARAISEIDTGANPDESLQSAASQGWPVIVDGDRIYLRKYHFAQARAAKILREMADREIAPLYRGNSLEREIVAAEMSVGRNFRLDQSQRDALRGILTSTKQIHTLTAGPGCGKTSIMEVMVGVLARSKMGVFAAPTGKAAKVLSSRLERHSLNASTIHTLLGVSESGFTHNENNPVFADYIVIDESSMLDVEIFGALLSAAPTTAHIIFLGDTNQLPSVGPGQMLADIKALDFDHHELFQTHRNAGGILHVVNESATGHLSKLDGFSDVLFSHGLPEATEASVAQIMLDYERAVERHGIHRVALLTARRKGRPDTPGWNTTYLNARLRERMNPGGEKIHGTFFYLQDRIVVRKNMALEQGKTDDDKPIIEAVVNGDTGTIQGAFYKVDRSGSATRDLEHIEVLLDDGRLIKFPADSLGRLAHAYAMTVHMSQGSEYDEVLFVCTNGMPTFIHRGIVFTAMSRAKKLLRVYADDHSLRSVVRRPIPKRNTAILEIVDRPRAAVHQWPRAAIQTQEETATRGEGAGVNDARETGDQPDTQPEAPIPGGELSSRVSALLGW